MIPRKLLIVTQHLPGTYVKGVYAPGTTTSTTIFASVQPATKNDIESLPEGKRNSKSYALFTNSDLPMVSLSTPDTVMIEGETYEMVRKEPWRNNVISHYKYIVVKVDG